MEFDRIIGVSVGRVHLKGEIICCEGVGHDRQRASKPAKGPAKELESVVFLEMGAQAARRKDWHYVPDFLLQRRIFDGLTSFENG